MRMRYPDVSLVLQDLTSDEQVEALAHRLDVGFVRPPVSRRGITGDGGHLAGAAGGGSSAGASAGLQKADRPERSLG